MNERMSSTDLSSITTHNPNFTIMNKTSIMQGSFVKKAELGSTNRRLVCRYGRGCTHSNDIVHREQYWHPSLKEHECKYCNFYLSRASAYVYNL